MHPDLELAFHRLVEDLKNDQRCHGGWHYGSVGRGTQDRYSDFDPVFLVSDQHFEAFSADIPRFLTQVADELLILWPEGFNDAHCKNFCSVIRLGEGLHQLDFFVLNSDFPETWMGRQHLKDCGRDQILFDRTGKVGALLDRGLRTDHDLPDPIRACDTYWFHLQMLIKYFKRKDLFKIIKNLDVLFHAHVDLLLSHHDRIDWGGWESKVRHGVPYQGQEHLKLYFAPADLWHLEEAVRSAVPGFRADAERILGEQGKRYRWAVADQIEASFLKRMDEVE